MSSLEIVCVARAALRSTKLRSLLTTLGIVIGVAAVITMVTLGRSAVGVSAAVGLFFGVWPARRAARLDPIESLRSE